MNKGSRISIESRSLPVLLALACAAPAAMTTHTVAAQQTNANEDLIAPAVEVTAFRVPTLLSETSQGVSVITGEEISARNPASVVDLLQQVPGLHIDQVGDPGGVSNVYIRGTDPEHVLVLIDGVRVNDPTVSRGGSYDLSSIDPANIERIEVIRGAGSAIFGADAIGGVINIVTKRGPERGIQGSVGGGLGGRNYGQANAQISGGTEDVQFAVNASKLQDGRVSDGGELDLASVDGSLTVQVSDGANIKLYARHNDRDSSNFPDASGGILFSVIRTLEQRDAEETLYGANFSMQPWNQVGFKLQVSRYEREEDIDSPGVSPGFPGGLPPTISHSEFTRDSVLASASLVLPFGSDLTIGYENLREQGLNRSVLDFGVPVPAEFDLTRDTNSGFAQLKSKPTERLIVTLEVRHDSVSGLDSETSPGAGVRYDFPATGTSLKARYAEGFRAPSFFALGSPAAFGGNPNLKSETTKGGEVGVEQSLLEDRARVGLSVFKTRVKDLIDFSFSPFGFVNRDTVDIEGVETQVAIKATDNLGAALTYTYVDAEIVNSTEELRNRPRHRASLSLQYRLHEAWSVVWNTAYAGKVFDESFPTGAVELDSFTRSDVAVSYKWQRLTATVAVDNVFDEKYEQFVGFENPGMRLRAALSARF